MKKKFRAFYGPDMDTPDGGLKFEQVEKDGKLYFQYEDLIYEFYIPFVDKDWTIQQYVGVDDINGKEIYEGDIVIWPPHIKDEDIPNPYSSGENRDWYFYMTRQKPKLIEWTHYMKFSMVDIPSDGSMTYTFNKHCEVIGNIFETPHLLNQNQTK